MVLIWKSTPGHVKKHSDYEYEPQQFLYQTVNVYTRREILDSMSKENTKTRAFWKDVIELPRTKFP